MGTRIKGQKNTKFTIGEIHNFSKLFNIEFLDMKYINNSHPHNWFCKTHNEKHTQALSKIKRSGGLKCCGKERLISSSKNTINKIEKLHNITLVSEYHSNHQLLTWECNMHNEKFLRSLVTIKKLLKPPCCKYEEKIKIIEEIIEPLGYELLDKEYIGSTHTWRCIRHNKTHYDIRTTYQDFTRGQLLKCCANEKIKGKNHPNYNYDVSDEQRINDRRSQKNKTWRQSVIRRDNLTCQCCGASNTKIVAHHLENYLENPLMRYDSDNGITLCVPCHIKFHSIYGRGATTKNQTEEWIINQSQESQLELPES